MERGMNSYTILMVGDSGIGKTMLAEVFVNGRGTFSDMYITTSGADLYKKTILVDGANINLKIWDLSGANEYRTRITYHFKDADGIMLCYSMTSQESWDNLDNWITTIQWQIGSNEFDSLEKLIVGLKCDLDKNLVSELDVAKKCSILSNTEVLLTSSKRCINVSEAFYSLVSRINSKKYPEPNVTQKTKRSICIIF